jgi:hypothetical protein
MGVKLDPSPYGKITDYECEHWEGGGGHSYRREDGGGWRNLYNEELRNFNSSQIVLV